MSHGSSPYQRKHKPLTSLLTREEHAVFAALAAQDGLLPSTKATAVLREFIAERRQTINQEGAGLAAAATN